VCDETLQQQQLENDETDSKLLQRQKQEGGFELYQAQSSFSYIEINLVYAEYILLYQIHYSCYKFPRDKAVTLY